MHSRSRAPPIDWTTRLSRAAFFIGDGSTRFTTCRRGKTGDAAQLLLGGWRRPTRLRLVDTNRPKRARLAWAIQVSFLELLSQFPSEKDLLQRCYNRYDKRGITVESLGSGRLFRIPFG